MKNKKKRLQVIEDYDRQDTSSMINPGKRLCFADLGLALPKTPPTQVISIRLPSELLNQIKALGSQHDVPYQALIKLMLVESLKRKKIPRKLIAV